MVLLFDGRPGNLRKKLAAGMSLLLEDGLANALAGVIIKQDGGGAASVVWQPVAK